jgi:PTH1 family peptidyl-tRNA hydrolase
MQRPLLFVSESNLIVGLGNPGAEYRETRHNAGFMAADRLASRWNCGWRLEAKFESEVGEAVVKGRRVRLLKPQTYMNESGRAVSAAAGYFRVKPEALLSMVDDADLALGTLRLRGAGSSGGHHGLESVERSIGTQAYPRLRIGIARPAGSQREITGHVLGRVSPGERPVWEEVLDRAALQAECWLEAGLAMAMNQYNGPIKASVPGGGKEVE